MAYVASNYSLLEQIHKDMSNFFDRKHVGSSLNLESILADYRPYSDIEEDEVANAICWCASIFQSLQKQLPVRALDEVLSFAESVLKRRSMNW